jgi:antitoxin component HigA of HigAB toxin-antitoxin module
MIREKEQFPSLKGPISDTLKIEVVNVGHLLNVPKNDKECAKLEELAVTLMVKTPGSPLLDTIGNLISEYENLTEPEISKPMSQAEKLFNLMESSGKKQTDMAEYFGGQSAVSAVLAGKRKISVAAAQKMSKDFNLSLDYFLSEE